MNENLLRVKSPTFKPPNVRRSVYGRYYFTMPVQREHAKPVCFLNCHKLHLPVRVLSSMFATANNQTASAATGHTA
jgi:hypothetical protein